MGETTGDAAKKTKRSFLDRFVLRKKRPQAGGVGAGGGADAVGPATEDSATTLARDAWNGRAAEVKGVEGQIADLTRWNDGNATAFATTLQGVKADAGNGNYAKAGTDLDTLKGQAAARWGVAQVKRQHEVAVAVLVTKTKAADEIMAVAPAPAPVTSGASSATAPSTGPAAATTSATPPSTGPAPATAPTTPPSPPTPTERLKAARTAYGQAKAACTYAAGDDAATLKNRRDAWEAAATELMDAYAARFPTGGAASVANAMNRQSAGDRERAGLVKPSTLAQADQKAAYDAQGRATFAAALEKQKKAMALLGASDVPVKDERAYVRLRAKAGPRIAYAATLTATPPDGLNKKEKAEYATAFTTFGTKNGLYATADAGLAASTDAERFTSALSKLRAAEGAADYLIGPHLAAAKKGVTGVAKKSSGKRSEAAQAFVTAADPALLKALDAEELVSLLQSLRRDQSYKADHPDEFKAAQAKVYKATTLDEGFKTQEAKLRKEVIQELMKDKAELKAARDEWPAMDEAGKLKILDKIVAAHCAKMGFEKPARITLYDAPPGESGAFAPSSNEIRVNRAGSTFQDFELMVDTIFHENSHNWQVQLSKRMKGTKPPPIKKSDPIYKQALLFDANEDGYDSEDAYNEQPQEAHSFRAGPVSAKALLKALSS